MLSVLCITFALKKYLWPISDYILADLHNLFSLKICACLHQRGEKKQLFYFLNFHSFPRDIKRRLSKY